MAKDVLERLDEFAHLPFANEADDDEAWAEIEGIVADLVARQEQQVPVARFGSAI